MSWFEDLGKTCWSVTRSACKTVVETGTSAVVGTVNTVAAAGEGLYDGAKHIANGEIKDGAASIFGNPLSAATNAVNNVAGNAVYGLGRTVTGGDTTDKNSWAHTCEAYRQEQIKTSLSPTDEPVVSEQAAQKYVFGSSNGANTLDHDVRSAYDATATFTGKCGVSLQQSGGKVVQALGHVGNVLLFGVPGAIIGKDS